MVLRNRKTLRKTRRNRKTLRNRKTRRNRKTLRIRGGNTTDDAHTTKSDIYGISKIEDTYVSSLGDTVPVNQLQEHMEHRAQEAY